MAPSGQELQANTTPFAQIFWCSFYAGGVIVTLVLYSILQERIMTMPYNGILFGTSVFLVFCNRIAAVTFSAVMLRASGETVWPQAPIWKYLIVSLTNVYASTCQYEALKYVSLVVQMLGKSFKMMPVMVWGMMISGKSYTARDWLVAVAVTLGVTEFLMTGPTASPNDTGNSLKGFLLMLLFLGLDGLTSTLQEKLFKEHKTSKYNQMMYVNGLSSVVSLITLIVTGKFVYAFHFWAVHPAFIGDALVLSGSAVAGQFFIYSLVKEFGALAFAATMNVRQVVSICASYITFGRHITPLQVVGLLAVFLALFYKSFRSLTDMREAKEREPLVAPPPKGENQADMEAASNIKASCS